MASNLTNINIKIEPEIKEDMEKQAKKLKFTLTKYIKSLHFMYRQELFGKLLKEMATLIDARNIDFLNLKLKDLLVLLMTDKEFNQVLNKSLDKLVISNPNQTPSVAQSVPARE